MFLSYSITYNSQKGHGLCTIRESLLSTIINLYQGREKNKEKRCCGLSLAVGSGLLRRNRTQTRTSSKEEQHLNHLLSVPRRTTP